LTDKPFGLTLPDTNRDRKNPRLSCASHGGTLKEFVIAGIDFTINHMDRMWVSLTVGVRELMFI
jgi:hypothetical protein